MKKSLIAAGAASLAVAAMPVVGVFADSAETLIDTVQLTVDRACTFEATRAVEGSDPIVIPANGMTGTSPNQKPAYLRNFAATLALGQVVELGGVNGDYETTTGVDGIAPTTINVSCNSNDVSDSLTDNSVTTWRISAVGSQTVANGLPVNAMVFASSSSSDATSYIPSGTTHTVTSGTLSDWAFKINAITGNSITNYTDYSTVPVTATDIVSVTPSTTDVEFTPSYRVYAGTNQQAQTYTGAVTYTLTDPWTHPNTNN